MVVGLSDASVAGPDIDILKGMHICSPSLKLRLSSVYS